VKKIVIIDAYQGLDEMDLKVIDQELDLLYHSDQRGNREMTKQFFLESEDTIVLEVYWGGSRVQKYRFKNKGVLTEEGQKAVGRPSLGTTKKVSITLDNQLWEKISETIEEHDTNRSALFREIIEGYYQVEKDYSHDSDYQEFKDFVFSTDPKELIYHLYQHGLFIGAAVEEVNPYYEDAGVEVRFTGGNIHVWSTNKVTKCFRPANLLIQCETCFHLCNEYGESIGYVYKKN
jgi:hypothetical protein